MVTALEVTKIPIGISYLRNVKQEGLISNRKYRKQLSSDVEDVIKKCSEENDCNINRDPFSNIAKFECSFEEECKKLYDKFV